MRSVGFSKAVGSELTNYTLLDSIDGLFNYVWRKLNRTDAFNEVRDAILARSVQRSNVYRHADGSYRFRGDVWLQVSNSSISPAAMAKMLKSNHNSVRPKEVEK
jgi:hypothetical protein